MPYECRLAVRVNLGSWSALGFAEGRAGDADGDALLAQAAEQGRDHVLVAEEVQPVIVVEVGRNSVESRVKLLVMGGVG
jgi:hypothetical protein